MKRPRPAQSLAVLALLIAVAWSVAFGVPALLERSHATEAINQLARLARGASVYYVKPRAAEDGTRLVCQFPPGEIRSTMAASCCDPSVALPGTKLCDPAKVIWNRPLWNALHFRLDEPHAFVYRYQASGTLADANFVVEAFGDLDCDGTISTFRFVGRGDPEARPDDCVLRTHPVFETGMVDE